MITAIAAVLIAWPFAYVAHEWVQAIYAGQACEADAAIARRIGPMVRADMARADREVEMRRKR